MEVLQDRCCAGYRLCDRLIYRLYRPKSILPGNLNNPIRRHFHNKSLFLYKVYHLSISIPIPVYKDNGVLWTSRCHIGSQREGKVLTSSLSRRKLY